jgi:uncharacterized protein YcbK (DUF882 family)
LPLRFPLVSGPVFLKRTGLRTALAFAALSTVLLLTPARARELSAATPAAETATTAVGQKYELKLHHLHTGESLDVVYRVGDTYIPAAMEKLNHFLRDHRTNDVSHYDPKEFDLLHTLMTKLGKNGSVIDVVCGYRTPWSNNFLRTRGGTASPAVTGVAQNSQHMQARAIDIRVPGVATAKLRDTALSLHGGGVGYYPVSQFVHVDVGPVRQWTFAGKGDN